MKFSVAIVATNLAVAAEAADRRLSYEMIAGYKPESQVTDHCAIDLDQAAIERQLGLSTNESFLNAAQIYNNGGNSKSYAQVTLTEGLASNINKGDVISGKNADGNEISGKSYDDYESATKNIKVLYETTDVQASYVECQVGSLKETNVKGCFTADGDLTIGGTQHAYTYTPATDNKNDRTIAGFSTGAAAKMLNGCPGCPYTDFKYFNDYYGTPTYADEWVSAALEGRSTTFPRNGNANFAQYGFDGRTQAVKKGTAYLNIFMYVIREFEDALDDYGRTQAVKKGTAYLNIFMYVIREFEDALDDCKETFMQDNYNSVNAWDEGVCFYTGSIEGADGVTEDGKLLHQLADKRCTDYKTCGPEGIDQAGKAKVNYDMFDMLALGKEQVMSGNCPGARNTVKKITSKMYIPMIQGAMRYAYKVEMLQGGETEKAEGATFAAAVLPRVNAESSSAASTIYNNLSVGAGSTDFKQVKAAFESVYPALGITCADVGGLWNEGEKAYYPGMEPCGDGVSTMDDSSGAMISTGASLSLALVLTALF
eukprot:CAMPEP_0172330940 /NCGR_PEP_ID=MMETSP1058-20130122/61665_1 /TAXON_ID=83371 /ORGANISM="Detonula confervacea, Strain CCMP 353" /LENGTH=539 /DNA_ID=CAMNT_0013048177 /DNA_START=105 /DNA_END=1724 /DNA_ORIENTATION=-